MTERTLDLIFALGLLGNAAELAIFLYLRHLNRLTNRIIERSNPEFPDLTPMFIELQQRIASEAEKTRTEATSHSKNAQTAAKTLTGVMKKVQTRQDLTMSNINTVIAETQKQIEKSSNDLYTALIANAQEAFVDTFDIIRDEHKKTRKETQEIKTRLTASRKRELLDIEEEKAAKKAKATKAPSTTKKPSASKSGGM